MQSLKERIDSVLERIGKAAISAGRRSDEVKLVAVSKGFPSSVVREARNLGISAFGENRAQELRKKAQELSDLDIEWHFIGRIQTNKIRHFVPLVEYVHSVWRVEEAVELERRSERIGKAMKIFVEVNVSGEKTKAGVDEGNLGRLLEEISSFPHLEIVGLMTMAPYVEDPEEIRWVFRKLRRLRDELSRDFPSLKELSMGMSNDFEVAIQEGATFVRIGSAIFGPRDH